MTSFRGIVAGLLGGAVAGVALRVHAVAQTRDTSITDVVADLPGILGEDVSRVSDAARHAVADGRAAAAAARVRFDEQVVAHRRRTEVHDV